MLSSTHRIHRSQASPTQEQGIFSLNTHDTCETLSAPSAVLLNTSGAVVATFFVLNIQAQGGCTHMRKSDAFAEPPPSKEKHDKQACKGGRRTAGEKPESQLAYPRQPRYRKSGWHEMSKTMDHTGAKHHLTKDPAKHDSQDSPTRVSAGPRDPIHILAPFCLEKETTTDAEGSMHTCETAAPQTPGEDRKKESQLSPRNHPCSHTDPRLHGPTTNCSAQKRRFLRAAERGFVNNHRLQTPRHRRPVHFLLHGTSQTPAQAAPRTFRSSKKFTQQSSRCLFISLWTLYSCHHTL